MAGLLLVSCTASKDPAERPLAAWDRYTGRTFRLLKRLQCEGLIGPWVEVAILSAKYGILRPSDVVDLYDQQMTATRAAELHPQVRTVIQAILERRAFDTCFILMQPVYRQALGSVALPADRVTHDEVSEASAADLRVWLLRAAHGWAAATGN